ncbi:High-affinity choline transporter 1 [Aphelenchoides fujianensis]|nr:High-affinity choline transporter 1 [Aphelenchoides fujianensis]
MGDVKFNSAYLGSNRGVVKIAQIIMGFVICSVLCANWYGGSSCFGEGRVGFVSGLNFLMLLVNIIIFLLNLCNVHLGRLEYFFNVLSTILYLIAAGLFLWVLIQWGDWGFWRIVVLVMLVIFVFLYSWDSGLAPTWVGGAYINGTAEALHNNGILGCQAPLGYALSLIVGGMLFAKKMRDSGYVTMLDPFQIKYGGRVGGPMFVPALLGEVFWSAAILSALGSTLSVILNWSMSLSIIVSAFIAVSYTFFGGLYAVAYTDIVQLFCIFIGLWICVPAALFQEKTASLGQNMNLWIGEMGSARSTAQWVDNLLLIIFGGIPWQVYFQRVLSARTSAAARGLSFVAGIGCIIMAIPAALLGAIARNTDWRLTDYDPFNNGTRVEHIPLEQTSMVVPLVFQFLTPKWVSFIGLGAVSAAVMSSADSSVLSAASMFSHNIWKLAINPRSVYALWYLCADLVYVILFPQLFCVVYFERSNTYGSLLGYFVGLGLRVSGGEPLLHLPALIRFPWFDENRMEQKFPFKTLTMLTSLGCCFFGSLLTHYLFQLGLLPPNYDLLGCFVDKSNATSTSAAFRPPDRSPRASLATDWGFGTEMHTSVPKSPSFRRGSHPSEARRISRQLL